MTNIPSAPIDHWVTALLLYAGGIATGLMLAARKLKAPPVALAPRAPISGIYDRSDKVLAAEERKRKGLPDMSPRERTGRVVYDTQAPGAR